MGAGAGTAGSPRRLNQDVSRAGANAWLFFKRWLANPLQMGSIVPSSPALCRRIAALARAEPGQIVIELGAGTGVVSRALIDHGLDPSRLYVVEIVPDLAEHLHCVLPGAHILQGDARRLPQLIPPHLHGRVSAVIVGIPLVLLPLAEQRRFIDAIAAVAPGLGFLLYSYCVTSPLPWKKHGLRPRREAWTPLNFPPASIWRYTPSS